MGAATTGEKPPALRRGGPGRGWGGARLSPRRSSCPQQHGDVSPPPTRNRWAGNACAQLVRGGCEGRARPGPRPLLTDTPTRAPRPRPPPTNGPTCSSSCMEAASGSPSATRAIIVSSTISAAPLRPTRRSDPHSPPAPATELAGNCCCNIRSHRRQQHGHFRPRARKPPGR